MALHRHRKRKKNHREPSIVEVQSSTVPAPILGVDTRVPIGDMPIENCVYAYNIGPSEYGVSTRPGYRQYVLNVENTTALGVTSLIPYVGSTVSRLYGVTNEGIWDVSTYNSAPVQKYTFVTDTTATAGWGVFIAYIDQAGKEWLFYADSTNGLFECDVVANTWAVYAGITGVAAADIAFIEIHKNRIWLVERDASSAWYLPLNAKTGAATEFYFGTKFKHGGTLVGVWNWSVDGGVGVDDYLVAVSSTGDVIPYQGSDPSASEWQARGMYFIGQLPAGRRIASEYRGDLHILSSYGLISMSDLLRGVENSVSSEQSLTFRIARVIRENLVLTSGNQGWQPQFLPSLGILLISAPKKDGFSEEQYSSSLSAKGWSFWRGVAIRSFTEWNGKVYFGSNDNNVYVLDAERDAMEISPADPASNGMPIDFSILMAFNRAGDNAKFKQVIMVRPDFYAPARPNWDVRVLYDYEVLEVPAVSGDTGIGTSAWDGAEWDQSIWGGSVSVGYNELQGSSGIGRSVGIALRGQSAGSTVLLSVDVMWKEGHQI